MSIGLHIYHFWVTRKINSESCVCAWHIHLTYNKVKTLSILYNNVRVVKLRGMHILLVDRRSIHSEVSGNVFSVFTLAWPVGVMLMASWQQTKKGFLPHTQYPPPTPPPTPFIISLFLSLIGTKNVELIVSGLRGSASAKSQSLQAHEIPPPANPECRTPMHSHL